MSQGKRIQRRVVDSAIKVTQLLQEKKGPLARAARALDKELGLKYLSDRLRLEEQLIQRFIDASPGLAGKPKVSIAVPVYGIAVQYIEEFVKSINAQTYDNWELCFCDDGDPDDQVRKYLEKLCATSSTFKLKRHPTNQGIAQATKTALSLCDGDFIAFSDADDLLHPRTLETVLAGFSRTSEEEPEIDFVYTDNDHTTDLGHRRAPVMKPGWSPELLQCVNYVNHLAIVRRSCLEQCENLFPPGCSGGQDWDMCLKVAEHARGVVHIPLPLYHWRKRPGSIAADVNAKPWVRDACMAVRRAHLARIDSRLTLKYVRDGEKYKHHYEPAFKPSADLPSLAVMVFGADIKPSTRTYLQEYAGWQRVFHLNIEQASTNGELLKLLGRKINSSEAEFVFVLDGKRPSPKGDLNRMLAFGIQPNIGCVWPFATDTQRLAYTISEEKDLRKIVQVAEKTNIFSRFSGNVLTGPLHGMLVSAGAWFAAVEWLERLGEEGVKFLDSSLSVDAIGAAVGLSMRATKKRNVGCRGMRCAIELTDVSVPQALLPSRDPWV